MTRPQITEVGPPEGRASEREAERAVQELRMAKARPSMASGEKLRCSSCLWPSLARCEESLLGGATTLDFRREVDIVAGWCEMRWVRAEDEEEEKRSRRVYEGDQSRDTVIAPPRDCDETATIELGIEVQVEAAVKQEEEEGKGGRGVMMTPVRNTFGLPVNAARD